LSQHAGIKNFKWNYNEIAHSSHQTRAALSNLIGVKYETMSSKWNNLNDLLIIKVKWNCGFNLLTKEKMLVLAENLNARNCANDFYTDRPSYFTKLNRV
jgi:hypothetical protein